MLSRVYRRIGSLLGLLAILMATLAPTVSQTLAATRTDHSMTGGHCSMPSMQHQSPDSDTHPGSTMSDGQACGYCSLLAHMPVIPGVQAAFAVTIRAIQHPVATRFESVRLVEPLTPAQPRAPPVSS
ncbi:DUF2946 domain-containing protein [Paraburkholderia sp. BL10I2N1]|uniref:DUF2946 domain-containing protein n=1 Tax=Paraburkholderia sp. BL10I2N1 TaxID=1938796 RepID=UPI0010610343|nr:DUF2946 domain-containing protein [Paraburkholderia sp. BL10I2N1]TDN62021.1 DUF2946 family protein [Paraburkholderia sp. BL10I2N1]